MAHMLVPFVMAQQRSGLFLAHMQRQHAPTVIPINAMLPNIAPQTIATLEGKHKTTRTDTKSFDYHHSPPTNCWKPRIILKYTTSIVLG